LNENLSFYFLCDWIVKGVPKQALGLIQNSNLERFTRKLNMQGKSTNNSYWPYEWKRFKEGDRKAFQKIYDYFYDRMYWYGMKIYPDIELVEDAIQELFLKLYTSRENLSITNQVEFYLLKSIRFTIYQKLRSRNRLEDLSVPLDSFKLELATDSDEEDSDLNSRIEMMQKSIDSLSPAAQEILYLKFYSGLDYRQIGDLLGVQPDSAKKQVYRVISRLKEIMANKFMELFCICFRA